jgi:acyl-coenzyme A synthetase/AMP-(fatty) acid ligase
MLSLGLMSIQISEDSAVVLPARDTWADGENVPERVDRQRFDGEAASESELVDRRRARPASYQKPTRVIFVDHLPRNACGKILKRELRVSGAS